MRDLRHEIIRRVFKLRPSRAGRVERRKDLAATMSDGVVLLADHYIPDGDTTAPLVLMRSPYGRRTVLGLVARALAHEGFQVVIQSCRGTAGSGGRFDRPFACEADDGRDTVVWLRDQPFYPGSFATFCASYLGYVQLALPPESKTDLFAAVLQITPTNTQAVVWPNEALALATSLGWAISANRNPASLMGAVWARRDRARVHTAGMTAPLMQTYKKATGSPVGFLEDWWAHPDRSDAFWRDQDHHASLDTFTCPVLVQSGWYDLLLESSIEQYSRLAANGVDVRLTVGPWTHATFGSRAWLGMVVEEAADFLRAAVGLTPPIDTPPVRLLDARSGAEQRIASWPPAVEAEVYHLAPSRLQRETPAIENSQTSFTYDPSEPTPQLGGPLLDSTGGPLDNAELERRSDVLTFDAPPFTTDVEYVGWPTVELWVAGDVPAPQLFVRLNVVDAAGRSTNITDTMATLRTASDAPTQVSIALPPTCLRLHPGERLRLLVAGGAFPRFARSPGTGESPASATTFRVAHIAIRHDVDHPSRLTMPRRPTNGR